MSVRAGVFIAALPASHHPLAERPVSSHHHGRQPSRSGNTMMHQRLRLFAFGAIAMLAGVTQAAAGCCPPTIPNCGCGPVVAPAPLAVVPEMYVVNQGPVYSGPGPYVTQRNWIEGDQVAPIGYPYVGYVVPSTAPRRYYYGPEVRPRGYVRPPLRVLGRAAPAHRARQVSLARR
jgi:hypothetical protein